MAILTQVQILRTARQFGVRCESREGARPDASLTEADVHQGVFALVKGRPEESLHELVHGALGPRPKKCEKLLEQFLSEELLVAPLEWALMDELTGSSFSGPGDRLQLRAAGLLGPDGKVIRRQIGAADWKRAAKIMRRRLRVMAARETRRWRGTGLPAWW